MSNDNLRVLFICNGNTFRSMVAEYCMKDYLLKKGIQNIHASSAGINVTKPIVPDPKILKILRSLGINATKHRPVKISKKLVKNYDILIAMHKEQRDFIRSKFNLVIPLFNEIVIGKSTSIKDIDYSNKEFLVEKGIKDTIVYIHEKTPDLVNHLN